MARREREASVLQFVRVAWVALRRTVNVFHVRQAPVPELNRADTGATDRRVRLTHIQEVGAKATDRVLTDIGEHLKTNK